MQLIDIFRARVVDVSDRSMCIAVSGDSGKVTSSLLTSPWSWTMSLYLLLQSALRSLHRCGILRSRTLVHLHESVHVQGRPIAA
jgi:hypothetical protein